MAVRRVRVSIDDRWLYFWPEISQLGLMGNLRNFAKYVAEGRYGVQGPAEGGVFLKRG
jgi:hypothetical protein